MGRETPQRSSPAVPTLRVAEPARNTSDVDVDKQLPIESASGDSLPDAPLADVPLPEVRPDGSVGEELTSLCIAEETTVVAFRLWSDSCLVRFLSSKLFISGIYYYTRWQVLHRSRFILFMCFVLLSFLLVLVYS